MPRDDRQADSDDEWYGVRCVFRVEDAEAYEERVTVWEAASSDEAIEKALAEAQEYADGLPLKVLGLAQSYHLTGPPSETGSEVFSLIRSSGLDEHDYLKRFFTTGHEHSQRGEL